MKEIQNELEQIIRITEEYLEKPLHQYDIKTLIYFKYELGFSNELIDFLIRYCVELGHKSFRYIEKVAMLWYEKGIKTPEEAKFLASNKYMDVSKIVITAEMIQTLDDRALQWYRKHITQFHQECLRFDKCYCGDPKKVFHEHFKAIEKLLSEEIERREQYYKEQGIL